MKKKDKDSKKDKVEKTFQTSPPFKDRFLPDVAKSIITKIVEEKLKGCTLDVHEL